MCAMAPVAQEMILPQKPYSWKKADFIEKKGRWQINHAKNQNSVIKKHFPFDKASRGTRSALLDTKW